MSTPAERLTMTGFAWRALRHLLIAYLLLVLLMTLIENWMVYPIPPVDRADWARGDARFENVDFTSADGTKLHGWYLDQSGATRTVVYFHGNGEQVGDNVDLIPYLAQRLNARVFLFDYRGYGRSEGKPFEKGLVADGLAAQRWLAERVGCEPGEVTLVGRSLGGGVAVACAAELGAEALVLQSTFTRITDVAAERFPFLPVRQVMRNRYDSLARIQEFDGPTFISHGTKDYVIPFEHGKRLLAASPSKQKQFFEQTGRGHNEPQPRAYYEVLNEFLQGVAKENQ